MDEDEEIQFNCPVNLENKAVPNSFKNSISNEFENSLN